MKRYNIVFTENSTGETTGEAKERDSGAWVLYKDHEAVVNELVEALEELEKDMHQFSTRPCSTCRNMSKAIGRPFGCEAKALARAKG